MSYEQRETQHSPEYNAYVSPEAQQRHESLFENASISEFLSQLETQQLQCHSVAQANQIAQQKALEYLESKAHSNTTKEQINNILQYKKNPEPMDQPAIKQYLFAALHHLSTTNTYPEISALSQKEITTMYQLMGSVDDIHAHNIQRNTLAQEEIHHMAQKGIHFNPNGSYHLGPKNNIIHSTIQEAYPFQTAHIISTLKDWIDILKNTETKTPEETKEKELKLNYYQKLLPTFGTTNPQIWKQADMAMISQTAKPENAVLINHSIETAYTPTGQRRIDFVLWTPNAENAQMQPKIQQIKQELIESFEEIQAENKVAPEATNTQPLKKSVIGLFNITPSGGISAISGKVAPNGADLKAEGGVLVIINKDRAEQKLADIQDLQQGLVEEKSMLPPTEKNVEDTVLFGITSHEFGHAIGNSLTATKRLQKDIVEKYLEEGKASLMGFLGNISQKLIQDPTNTRLNNAFDFFLRYSISLATADAQAVSKSKSFPYLRRDLRIVQIIEETNMFTKNEKGLWQLRLDDEKIRQETLNKLHQEAHISINTYTTQHHDKAVSKIQDFLATTPQKPTVSEYVNDFLTHHNLTLPAEFFHIPGATTNTKTHQAIK